VKFINLLKKELSEIITVQMIATMGVLIVVFMMMGNLMSGAIDSVVEDATNPKINICDLDDTELTDSLMESFGITSLANQMGFTLSGGERRRTEIARALATNPKFLLLDEPFAGIDPKAVYEIKQIIKKLAQQNIGVLITDHNVRDTLSVTNCSHIISDGEILVSGGKAELLANEIAKDIYFGSSFEDD